MEIPYADLSDFASAFVRGLPVSTQKKAYIVGLTGELGAGKTTFVQEVAKALGVSSVVASPTFVVVRVYPLTRITHTPFKRLVHIDAYRLVSGERDTIGFGAYAENPENLILVEWPERLPGAPAFDTRLEFKVVSEDTREIIQT